MAKEYKTLEWLEQYALSPASNEDNLYYKMALHCYLNGVDAKATLMEFVNEEKAEKLCGKARRLLADYRTRERRNPRGSAKETRNEFTLGNFRIKIDTSQDRDYGMVNISIYSIVEVWADDSETDTEKEYLINFSDYKTKEWLIRLLVWGLMNKKEIVIKPATEAEMSSMKMFIPKDKQD